MFIKKFSEKHLRVGARTWRPRDRDEIYRQRYLASLGIDPSQDHRSSQPILTPVLHHQPISSDSATQQSRHDLRNHGSAYETPTHDLVHDPPTQDQAMSTRTRATSLHLSSASRSQHRNLDRSSLLSTSRKIDNNSPRRASISTRPHDDAPFPITAAPPVAELPLVSDSIDHQQHPHSHFSQNLSTSHPASLHHQSNSVDHYQLDTASQMARQSQKEYATSCALSDYGRQRLRESQEAYQIAKERYSNALNAAKHNDPEPIELIEDSRSVLSALKYNNPELNNALEFSNVQLGDTPRQNDSEFNDTLGHHKSECHDNFTHDTPLQQNQEQAELPEQRLNQIREQTQQQDEIYEQKLKQIREMETLLNTKEKEVEIRVKQLEEALETERLKCQEYTIKAQQLEEALEAERLQCVEQIKIAQETADRTARESIKRAEEERQRKYEEIQKESEEKQRLARQEYEAERQRKYEEIEKDSEEKQRLARQEYEAERRRLEEAHIQLELERKEEKRKETEARMLAEMEKLSLETQAQLNREAQAIADRERDKVAIRRQIQERDRKKPDAHPDRRRAELIASYQPIAMWDFDPLPGYLPPPYASPSFPLTPMSPRIVPEAVKKAACAQKEHHEKLQQKRKAEEEARLMQLKQNLERELVERRRAHQYAVPDQSRHEQNQTHWDSDSFNGRDRLPSADEPPKPSASPLHTNSTHSIPHVGPQPQSTDKARPSRNEDPTMVARKAKLNELEAIALKRESRRNQNENHWGMSSLSGRDQLPSVDDLLNLSAQPLHMNSPHPTSPFGFQPQSADKTRSSHHENSSIAARESKWNELEALTQKHEEMKRKEDAEIAKRRAALENSGQQAMTSENTGPRLPQKTHELPEAQIRAAEVAAHIMAEQASSKSSRRKTPQIRESMSRRVGRHDRSPSNSPTTSSAAQWELPPQAEDDFQVYATDHVPGYAFERVKPIESSVVLRVDQPSPMDYLKNDMHGQEYRLQSDQLARQALIVEAKALGANAIICLSHPSPVLVDHTRVNFSAKGIAVILKTPSAVGRAGLDDCSPHPPELDASHPLHYECTQPTIAFSNNTPASPESSDSVPFGNPDYDTQSAPKGWNLGPSLHSSLRRSTEAPVPKNQQLQNANRETSHDGLESSIKSHANHNNTGFKSPGHRNRHSPRVIQEEHYVVVCRDSERASQLPKPPSYVTPKVVLHSPSENSTLHESKDSAHFASRNHSAKSSPNPNNSPSATGAGANTTSSSQSKTNACNSGFQGSNSISSPSKSHVNSPSPRVGWATGALMHDVNFDEPASATEFRWFDRATGSVDEAASPADLGSVSRVTNTDFVEEAESRTSSLRQSSPSFKRKERKEHKNSSSHSRMAIAHHGKLDSTHDVQPKEQMVLKGRTESAKAQQPILTKKLICSNSALMNRSPLLQGPEKSQDHDRRFTDFIHSSPLTEEWTIPEASSLNQIASTNRVLSLNKYRAGAAKVDDAVKATQQGSNPGAVEPSPKEQAVISAEDSQTSISKTISRGGQDRPTEFDTLGKKGPNKFSPMKARSSENDGNKWSSSSCERVTRPESRTVDQGKKAFGRVPKEKKRTNNPSRVDKSKKVMQSPASLSGESVQEGFKDIFSISSGIDTNDNHSRKADMLNKARLSSTSSEKSVSTQEGSVRSPSIVVEAKRSGMVISSGTLSFEVIHATQVEPSALVRIGNKDSPRAPNSTQENENLNIKEDFSRPLSTKQALAEVTLSSHDDTKPPITGKKRPIDEESALKTLPSAECLNAGYEDTFIHPHSPSEEICLTNSRTNADEPSLQNQNPTLATQALDSQINHEESPFWGKLKSQTTSSAPKTFQLFPLPSQVPDEACSPLMANTVEYLLSRSSRSTTPFYFVAPGLHASHFPNHLCLSPVNTPPKSPPAESSLNRHVSDHNKQPRKDIRKTRGGKQSSYSVDYLTEEGFDADAQNKFKVLKDPIIPVPVHFPAESKSSSDQKAIENENNFYSEETLDCVPYLT